MHQLKAVAFKMQTQGKILERSAKFQHIPNLTRADVFFGFEIWKHSHSWVLVLFCFVLFQNEALDEKEIEIEIGYSL